MKRWLGLQPQALTEKSLQQCDIYMPQCPPLTPSLTPPSPIITFSSHPSASYELQPHPFYVFLFFSFQLPSHPFLFCIFFVMLMWTAWTCTCLFFAGIPSALFHPNCPEHSECITSRRGNARHRCKFCGWGKLGCDAVCLFSKICFWRGFLGSLLIRVLICLTCSSTVTVQAMLWL